MSAQKVETLEKSTPSRRTVSQMFGIYRARTPDKLDAPPGKHTRALFLSAVVTGVALVVGLTLLDVSTNSSSLKSTPVLHLTRHRQDLFVDSRTSESPDVLGVVEEMKEATLEPPVTTVENETDVVSIQEEIYGEEDNNKDNEKGRTARTHLFPIESLKRHRTQYLKDYFVDGKHDPQSIGYYILQKQNGEYYLRNYSEPMWGTRIRRRFSNRMYPPQQMGTNPFQFIRRSDHFDQRFQNGDGIKLSKTQYDAIDRMDHSRRNHDMTTLRKYFNPYSKRADTGISQTGSQRHRNLGGSYNPFRPTPSTDGEENEDLDPTSYYQFTPIPVFSDSYAQLDPYKNNREIKSIKDIVKYLTTSFPRLERSTTMKAPVSSPQTSATSGQKDDKLEDLMSTSSAAKVTRLQAPSHSNVRWKDSNDQTSRRINRKRGMRISGSYRMPIEAEDLRSGASGLVETLLPPPMQPFAYTENSSNPDPFAKYRPLDPSEINQLVASRPSRPPGSMFMNTIRSISSSPNQYSPKPSHERNPVLNGISLNPNYSPSSHTVALFKPNGSSGRHKYHQSGSSRKKPVSVTLDIYPMTMEHEQGNKHDDATKLSHEDDVMNDQWSPRNPDVSDKFTGPNQMESQGSDNHMVVHLNVYPKGITSKFRSGIGRQRFWNPPLPVAAYHKRAMNDNHPASTAVTPNKFLEEINSTATVDTPFLEYNSEDSSPPFHFEENPDENPDDSSEKTENGVFRRTKGFDNGKDYNESIPPQITESVSNETADYGKFNEIIDGKRKIQSVQNSSLNSETQSESMSSENYILEASTFVNSNREVSNSNETQKLPSDVTTMKNDSFVEEGNPKYHYRLISDNSNASFTNDSGQISHETTTQSIERSNDYTQEVERQNVNDKKFSDPSNSGANHKQEGLSYDYDLNDDPATIDYKDYVNDSADIDYRI